MTYSMLPVRRLVAFSALTLCLAVGTAIAAEKGDVEAGAAKAATCTACHGLNGNSVSPEWPVIAGQNANYLSDQVLRIQTGKRSNPTMQPMVKSLTAQDIADLAAFFAEQTPTGNEADPSYWKAGQKLYRSGDAARGIPSCTACHGPLGRGNPAAGYPALQAQHALYTMKQLDALANGTRYTKDAKGKVQSAPNTDIMKSIASRLSPEDRRNLASYIQGMR